MDTGQDPKRKLLQPLPHAINFKYESVTSQLDISDSEKSLVILSKSVYKSGLGDTSTAERELEEIHSSFLFLP